MKVTVIENETAIKVKLCCVLEQVNQRQNRAEKVMYFVDECIVHSEEQDLSTQLLQMQKTQRINSEEHLEDDCWVLPFIGFNSAK